MAKLTLVTRNRFLNGLGSHESFGASEFGGVGGLPAKEIEWRISHSSLAVQVGQAHPRPPPHPPTTTLSPSVQGHRSVKRKLEKTKSNQKAIPF